MKDILAAIPQWVQLVVWAIAAIAAILTLVAHMPFLPPRLVAFARAGGIWLWGLYKAFTQPMARTGKALYETWCGATGKTPNWDALSPEEQAAWEKVATIPDLGPPPNPTTVARKPPVLPVVTIVIGLMGLIGCASWWARTPQHVIDVAKISICVAQKKAANVPIESIVEQCGLENAQQVLDLLQAQEQIGQMKAGVCASGSASVSTVPSAMPSAKASASK